MSEDCRQHVQAWAAVLRNLGVPERRMEETVELAEAILERLRVETEWGALSSRGSDDPLKVTAALAAAEVALNDWTPPLSWTRDVR